MLMVCLRSLDHYNILYFKVVNHQVILGIAKFTGVFFLLLIVVSGTQLIIPRYVDYNKAHKDLDRIEREVILLEKDVEKHRAELHDLNVNPVAVERVAREKFGLCRKGERVVIFQDEDIYRDRLPE